LGFRSMSSYEFRSGLSVIYCPYGQSHFSVVADADICCWLQIHAWNVSYFEQACLECGSGLTSNNASVFDIFSKRRLVSDC
jgi:hypothetical protein